MTFRLKDLGPYRIERSEEYISGGSDNSYNEIIRVRGSKPNPPYFTIPGHLYKYSETELGLYLHERKNLWRPLGKILNERLDTHETEIMFHFPVSMFNEVSKIIPFVRKAIRGIPWTEVEKRELTLRFAKNRPSTPKGIEQIDAISTGKTVQGNYYQRDPFNSDSTDKQDKKERWGDLN